MKKILVVVLSIALVLGFAACSAEPADESPTTEPESVQTAEESVTASSEASEEGLVIGVALPQLDADGYAANLIGIQEAAAAYNIEVRPVDAQNSAEDQTRQIEDFVTSEVNAIILLPVDSAALVTAVKAAVEAGIPVVCMDRSVNSDVATATVESDNAEHGSVAADLMLAAAEKQGLAASDLKVLELLGDQASSSGVERHEGFTNRCKELGITIVSSLPTNWQADQAYNSTLDAFQANDEINAIFEASDIAMHSGVSSALEQLGKYVAVGKEGHIIITSVDGGPQGCEEVANGFIDGIAQQSLLDMGGQALEIAVKAINGETISNKLVRLAPVQVTIENATSKDLWPAKIAEKN